MHAGAGFLSLSRSYLLLSAICWGLGGPVKPFHNSSGPTTARHLSVCTRPTLVPGDPHSTTSTDLQPHYRGIHHWRHSATRAATRVDLFWEILTSRLLENSQTSGKDRLEWDSGWVFPSFQKPLPKGIHTAGAFDVFVQRVGEMQATPCCADGCS